MLGAGWEAQGKWAAQNTGAVCRWGRQAAPLRNFDLLSAARGHFSGKRDN
jgi:hypothetical protein